MALVLFLILVLKVNIHERQGYLSNTVVERNIQFDAVIRGSMSTVSNGFFVSHYKIGAPYSLFIIMKIKKRDNLNFEVRNIRISDLNNNTVFDFAGSLQDRSHVVRYSDGTVGARKVSYKFDVETLNAEKHKIVFEYRQGADKKFNSIILDVESEHQIEKSNAFLDILLSV